MKDLLLSLGWVDKGDVLVRYTDPRIGWKPEDGTLIVGYHEHKSKVFIPQALFSIIQMTPGEACALIRQPLTWQDIKRIIDIEEQIYKDAGNLSHEVFKKYPTEEAFYTEILKRFND